jgi:CheY-like chemotaxis protein/CHASE3 domain sensor protein
MSTENDWPASAGAVALRERRASTSVIAGFAVTLALIAGVMFLVYTRTRTTAETETRVENTRDAAAALGAAAGALTDIELADSHYVLTGTARYLSARDAGANALQSHLRSLRVLLADDSVQSGRLAAMEPLFVDLVARLRTAATTAGTESVSDDISTRFAEMQREQGRLLAQQQTELQHDIDALPFAFLGILLLASIALCIFYTIISGHIKQRGEAGKVLKTARRRAEAESNIQNTAVSRARSDIRSALTAILGYCDLPLESKTPAQDRFDLIRNQAGQIIAAVNDILKAPDIADAPPGAARMEAIHSNANAAYASSVLLPPAMRFTGHVLLAEDNADLQQVIKFYLQTAGAEVTIVSDGELAFDQAMLAWKSEKPFDLILMDVQMPKSNGRAATIRLRDAGYTHPIVALTAHATDRERGRCFAAGCNGFLSKPVDQDEFLQTMRRFLQPRVPSLDAALKDEADASANLQFEALRESFRAEIPSRIAEIGAAVLAENFAHVADLAHQLKGTAACFGLATIGAAAAALQTAAELPEPREAMQLCFQTLIERTASSAVPKAA